MWESLVIRSTTSLISNWDAAQLVGRVLSTEEIDHPMTAEYFWTLPSQGDGRGVPTGAKNRGDWSKGARHAPVVHDVRSGRYGNFDHLSQVARAAAVSGFAGVLVPFDPEGEESWIVAAALAREIPGLTFVTEFAPAFATPVYAAKMSTTLQRLSRGRFAWKLVVDEDPVVARRLGDRVEGADRYERAAEFLEIASSIWGASDVTFRGRFYEVEGGGLGDPLTRYPRPPVSLSGTTAEALALSATHGDLHVWEVGPSDELDALRASLNRQAAANGRQLRHGLRLSVLARETATEAWNDAWLLWSEAGAGSRGVRRAGGRAGDLCRLPSFRSGGLDRARR